MKNEEIAKDKMQKICDILKKETLDPARQQSREIVENAEMQAREIIENAKKEAENFQALAEEERVKKEKNFTASLALACRETVEELRQQIEQKLFQENLFDEVEKASSSKEVIARLVMALIRAVEEKGIDADLSAYIAKTAAPSEVAKSLAANFLEKLREKELIVGDFQGGVRVKLHNKQITLDMSDAVLKEMIMRYIHKDFRESIFQLP
ncbi:MAG: V-type ATP synthase subunit E [Chlamydiota bacterium]